MSYDSSAMDRSPRRVRLSGVMPSVISVPNTPSTGGAEGSSPSAEPMFRPAMSSRMSSDAPSPETVWIANRWSPCLMSRSASMLLPYL